MASIYAFLRHSFGGDRVKRCAIPLHSKNTVDGSKKTKSLTLQEKCLIIKLHI
jgi:hypothetical protein